MTPRSYKLFVSSTRHRSASGQKVMGEDGKGILEGGVEAFVNI
jgi:hypothetical protein